MRTLLCISFSLLIVLGLKSQDEIEINVLWDLVEKYDTLQAYGWGLDSNYCSTWQGIRCDEDNHITSLDLSHKGLTDTLPSTICQLTELTFLDIHNCGLTYLPPCITELTKLDHLSIRLNLFKEVPDIVWEISSLKSLDISKLCLTEIPQGVERLTQLKTLNVADNHFSNFDPVVYKLDSLDRLVMNNCGLQSLPDDIHMLQRLTSFSLRQNKLESIPERIGDIPNLFFLELSSNNITNLPEEIKNLDKLRTLNINDNQLESLPDALGEMEALYNMTAKNNNISTIPQSILSAPNLYSLFLQNNVIDELPDNMFEMERLKFLSLQDNHLDFDDVIPYQDEPQLIFNYDPQDSILTHDFHCANIGATLRLESMLDNPDVSYQWYKNDEPIPNANEGVFEINDITVNDAGEYHCTLSHHVVPSLTLYRRPIIVTTNSTLSVNKVIATSPSCPGGSDGSIVLDEICGVSPVSYDWELSDFQDLSAGIYSIVVTDGDLNELTLEIELEDPASITPNISVAKSVYNSTLGRIHLNPTGGTAPYEIFLDGEIACDNTLDYLSPGAYTIEVIDANLCNIVTTADVPLYTATHNTNLEAQVNIYPTVTNDFITIQMENYHNTEVVIYDMNGTTYAQQSLSSEETMVNVSSLESGMYIVQMSKKGTRPVAHKIIRL